MLYFIITAAVILGGLALLIILGSTKYTTITSNTVEEPLPKEATKKIIEGALVPTNIQVATVEITYAKGQKVRTKVYGHYEYQLDFGYGDRAKEPTAFQWKTAALTMASILNRHTNR